MIDELKPFNTTEFYDAVEFLMWEYDMSALDAVVCYCERNDVEIENVIPLVKKNEKIKSQIQQDGENLNMLPKRARLF